MTFVPVRKFGDRTKKTEFDFINRKPGCDQYVQRRLDKIAKKKEEALEIQRLRDKVVKGQK